MTFESKPLRMVTFDRVTVKFDKDGLYSTEDKDKIKALKEFEGVEVVKK